MKELKELYDKDKFTLLIVSDDPGFLELIQGILTNEYNLYDAANGKEALNKLAQMPAPDIIISDIIMDIMDGNELFDAVSHDDRYKAIPFIFLTGKPDQDEKLKSLEKGVVDYICKSFAGSELPAKIKALLKIQKNTRELEIKKIEKKISTIIRTTADEMFLIFEKKCKHYGLSPREKEVVKQLIYGLQIKDIAGKLFLSIHTVKNHIRQVYEKCRVQNRVELMNLFRG